MECCPLCNDKVFDEENFQVIKTNGKKTFDERGITCTIGQRVHSKCRKTFSKKRPIAIVTSPSTSCERSPVKTRHYNQPKSTVSNFDITTCCLFCAELIGKYDEYYPVRSLIFQETIRDVCLWRNDSWGISVLSRIECIIDLPAADAVYHITCNTNFRTGKNIPLKYSGSSKRRILGRPVDEERKDAFMQVVDWFENAEDERITLESMVKKMDEVSNGNSYSTKYFRKKARRLLQR